MHCCNGQTWRTSKKQQLSKHWLFKTWHWPITWRSTANTTSIVTPTRGVPLDCKRTIHFPCVLPLPPTSRKRALFYRLAKGSRMSVILWFHHWRPSTCLLCPGSWRAGESQNRPWAKMAYAIRLKAPQPSTDELSWPQLRTVFIWQFTSRAFYPYHPPVASEHCFIGWPKGVACLLSCGFTTGDPVHAFCAHLTSWLQPTYSHLLCAGVGGWGGRRGTIWVLGLSFTLGKTLDASSGWQRWICFYDLELGSLEAKVPTTSGFPGTWMLFAVPNQNSMHFTSWVGVLDPRIGRLRHRKVLHGRLAVLKHHLIHLSYFGFAVFDLTKKLFQFPFGSLNGQHGWRLKGQVIHL